MWICLNDAFVSAVNDTTRPGWLKIRARKRSHLETLFPGEKITESKNTDYRYRVFVKKEKFSSLVATKVLSIDYDNFKDSVKDDDLHDLYAGFWHDHYRYQKQHG